MKNLIILLTVLIISVSYAFAGFTVDEVETITTVQAKITSETQDFSVCTTKKVEFTELREYPGLVLPIPTDYVREFIIGVGKDGEYQISSSAVYASNNYNDIYKKNLTLNKVGAYLQNIGVCSHFSLSK
jgi:hypothetical protein